MRFLISLLMGPVCSLAARFCSNSIRSISYSFLTWVAVCGGWRGLWWYVVVYGGLCRIVSVCVGLWWLWWLWCLQWFVVNEVICGDCDDCGACGDCCNCGNCGDHGSGLWWLWYLRQHVLQLDHLGPQLLLREQLLALHLLDLPHMRVPGVEVGVEVEVAPAELELTPGLLQLGLQLHRLVIEHGELALEAGCSTPLHHHTTTPPPPQ